MASSATAASLVVLAVLLLLQVHGVQQQQQQQQQGSSSSSTAAGRPDSLWRLWDAGLSSARYIDLTHTLKPDTPIWKGFKHPQVFQPSVNVTSNKPYTYGADGFEATAYVLSSDQYGTQLDPPAHWSPWFPAIDELPPTFAVRPLVVISIAQQVARNPGHQLSVDDVRAWEAVHGRVPPDSVVFIRSDWYKRWDQPGFAEAFPFPGVTLAALKLLHLERRILLHGHEPLDTDTTPTLEGEEWLLRNGYTQAEGVANLDLVAPTGCLVSIGFPRFAGGTGGYARYVAICPGSHNHGARVQSGGALPKQARPLAWSKELGYRVRQ